MTKITFYSGVGSVTGANFLLDIGWRVLVDCGLIQGDRTAMLENRVPFAYDPATIDMLFVTHAHLDHVGRIPKLVKDGFKGTIYSTAETKSLAELIMEDSVSLLQKESERDGQPVLYEMQDMQNALALWKTIVYHTETFFEDPAHGKFSVYLKDAGHILGSSMFQFTFENKKIVFTGDLGNSPSPLLPDTESIEGADYLVMESVYGDRNHEPKEERTEKLKRIILDTVAKGGTLVIPAFSLERTQIMIYEIKKLLESKSIPDIPIFVDSPLATKITEIYKSSLHLLNNEAQKEGARLFDYSNLSYTESKEESGDIDHSKTPKIIIAGSGMSVGGRVRHHEEIYLPEAKNTILLVGYQTAGSLGRGLMEGAKKVSIMGKEIPVNAKIETIFGYSSHKDSDHLVEFVENAKSNLKKVFVVMGEPSAATFLAQRINDEVGIKAICPESAILYELE